MINCGILTLTYTACDKHGMGNPGMSLSPHPGGKGNDEGVTDILQKLTEM